MIASQRPDNHWYESRTGEGYTVPREYERCVMLIPTLRGNRRESSVALTLPGVHGSEMVRDSSILFSLLYFNRKDKGGSTHE